MSEPVSFSSGAALATWLASNAATAKELWVHVHKISSGEPSVTWDDCVVEALRVGWIDGTKKSLGPTAYLQRLSPRRKGSGWSQRNRLHVERLLAAGLMTDAGLAEVQSAKADGRWDAAYAGSATMAIPPEFLDELSKHVEAYAYFQTLNRRNLFAIYYRLVSAKTDQTKTARTQKLIAALTERKTIL